MCDILLVVDCESLPTLKSLQDAVTSKTEEDGEEYLSLVTHLLRYAVDDPGVPNPKEVIVFCHLKKKRKKINVLADYNVYMKLKTEV